MASNFNSRPSREYLTAVEALRKVPINERDRAFADATAADLEALASEHVGKKMSGRKSWRRMLGEKGKETDVLPGDDHVELRQSETVTYISHPYKLKLDQLREIVRVCDENKLDVLIDAKSWYFPGAAIRVTYRPRDPRA